MIAGWLLLVVALAYVGVLFGVAYAGDQRVLYPLRPGLRPIVYSLALAVYCSSWTFYGAVGAAARKGLAYLPIYLGPVLLFVLGFDLVRRLVRVTRERGITSIADFIGARFGNSHGLAALVAVVAVTAVVPYIGLQFEAVAMSFRVLDGTARGAVTVGGVDSALWCAALLAVFAILFGARSIDATEHHHGMMLAIALESLVKLAVFVAIAAYALWRGPGLAATLSLPASSAWTGLPSGFWTQTLLALCAMFCLPRQFHVGMVECDDEGDVRRARWMFPAYMAVISLAVLPIVAAGAALPALSGSNADAWVLSLPLAHGNEAMALVAFIGGFSAATGMVIVASVALATMISNDLVVPALLRTGWLHLERRRDLSRLVLRVRRIAIVGLAAVAYAYYRVGTQDAFLATTGLLAFAAVAQFAPALVAALYWRGASRAGVAAGLVLGFAVWAYTLLVPMLAPSASWLAAGPWGWSWLRPQALFGASGMDPIVHAATFSLFLNAGTLILVSLRWRPGVAERLRAATFINPTAGARSGVVDFHGRVTVGDLRTVATRIVGEQAATEAFDALARRRNRSLPGEQAADRALIRHTERLLASAVGAANARRILTGALSGRGLDLAEVMDVLDEASQELRFNRGILATTLENMAQGIRVVDADLRLVAWNRRYLELASYPEGMLKVGMPVADLLRQHAEAAGLGHAAVEAGVRRGVEALRSGATQLVEHVRADGTVVEVSGRALPGGGYVTTYTDVTASRRAERALRKANETLELRVADRTAELSVALEDAARAKQAAEAANLSKTRFLAAASHDLLQPLHAARLFTSALRQAPGLDGEVAQLAERIDASFHAAEGLLDALLDASRLDAGHYRADVSSFSLARMFDLIRAQFAVVAAQRGLRFDVAPTALVVRSDPELLRRIAQNLVSNALRYTRTGGVLLGARRAGDDVRIEVWDTGPGIPDAQRARIFDEFQRLDAPSPWGEKGLGLGLSICDRLAGLLGHRLDVRSVEGRGSCFSVAVPRDRNPPAAASAEQGGRPVHHGNPVEQLPARVLCVDNDPSVLDAMQALLGRWGIDCRVARDVAGARAALAEAPPDALLVDYHLDGDVDGLGALAILAGERGWLPPAAIVTADGSAALKRRAREAGFPLLRKPVRSGALRALLGALMRKGR